jgi:hypothetical protein
MSADAVCKKSAIPVATVLVLLASALIAQLSAAPTSRTFLLRVCNKAEAHSGTINLATASLTPDLSHMRVIGWVLLPNETRVIPIVFVAVSDPIGAGPAGTSRDLAEI